MPSLCEWRSTVQGTINRPDRCATKNGEEFTPVSSPPNGLTTNPSYRLNQGSLKNHLMSALALKAERGDKPQYKGQCLLYYPRKRTCAVQLGMSALGQKRTSGGAHDTRIDFATKRRKIDGFGQKRFGAIFQSFALCIRVTIGGNHDYRDLRPGGFGFWQ